MVEQFVAQHLAFIDERRKESSLWYWVRGGKARSAEVDFVFEQGGKIYPLEVKAGAAGKLRSLWQFVGEKQVSLAIRFQRALPESSLHEISQSIPLGQSYSTFNVNSSICRYILLRSYLDLSKSGIRVPKVLTYF